MTATPGCSEESGTCPRCVWGCSHRPGWFAPGEAERAAELLGMSLAELFERKLTVDFWAADTRIQENVFLLSPGRVGEPTGTVCSLTAQGVCVFYVDGRCEIHAAKPKECRESWCGMPEVPEGEPTLHMRVAEEWQDRQGQIVELLGYEPKLPQVTFLDALDFLLGTIDSKLSWAEVVEVYDEEEGGGV